MEMILVHQEIRIIKEEGICVITLIPFFDKVDAMIKQIIYRSNEKI